MNFLPNHQERYLAALRVYLQKSVLQHGVTSKNISRLKKIYLAEAFSSKNLEPIDIRAHSSAVLGAAFLLSLKEGRHFSVSLRGAGVYHVNRRLYTALLVLLAKNTCGKLAIETRKESILLQAENTRVFIPLPHLVQALGGILLTEYGKERMVIVLPVKKTEADPDPTVSEWTYITDCFSPVNVYFENVCGFSVY